jgi:hypothetical protein
VGFSGFSIGAISYFENAFHLWYLYEQCRRLLQRSSEMLIEPYMACDDQARHVDVLCFTDRSALPSDHQADVADTDSAVLPVALEAEAENNSAVQPVALEAEAENKEEDASSTCSEEDNILHDTGKDIETDSVRFPGESSGVADINNDGSQQASETLDNGADVEALEEELDITVFEATTSVHDDWLHRGSLLFDMDFHTYVRFTVRKPLPKLHQVSDVDRAEHCFLFDSHYALAKTHWQQLVTDGHAKLVVMEALKCPLPRLNNGEDNAVFKSLIGTLIKCPGPGHCADPLFCKAAFFQVTVPESSNQTPASELPDWIDHVHFTPVKCPLRMQTTHADNSALQTTTHADNSDEPPTRQQRMHTISRRTHADNVPSTFSCRLQWKARRAEIEVLANQATALSYDAKRILVLADTTLLRGFQSGSAARPADPLPATVTTPPNHSAARPGQSPPTWRFVVCFSQIWIQKSGQPFPPFAVTVLEYMGNNMHHPHQMSLAQFSAHHLREIIYNLDMLAIARSTKLTTTSKEKVEDETLEHVHSSGIGVETEFYGGENRDEPEDDDAGANSWRPWFEPSLDRLTAILARHSEVASPPKSSQRDPN